MAKSLTPVFTLLLGAIVAFSPRVHAEAAADNDTIGRLEKRIEALENTDKDLATRVKSIENVVSSHNLIAFSAIEDVPVQLQILPVLTPNAIAYRKSQFVGWINSQGQQLCQAFKFRPLNYSRWIDSEGRDKASVTCSVPPQK